MVPRFFRRYFASFAACLSGLLLLPWILGVPGNPTPGQDFAWTSGLLAMIAYLAIFQCVKMIQSRDILSKPKLSTLLDSGLHAASIGLSAVLGVAVILLVWGKW